MILIEDIVIMLRSIADYYSFKNDPRRFGYNRAINAINGYKDIDVLIKDINNKSIYGIGPAISDKILYYIENNQYHPSIIDKLVIAKQSTNPHKHYMDRNKAKLIIDPILRYLEELSLEYYLTGSYRRGKLIVGDMDILIVGGDPTDLLLWLDSKNYNIQAQGNKKIKLSINDELEVDIRFCNKSELGTMLMYFTGPASYNVALRGLVKSRGMSLSEYGVKDKEGNLHTFNTEKECYEFLGLQYVEPNNRS